MALNHHRSRPGAALDCDSRYTMLSLATSIINSSSASIILEQGFIYALLSGFLIASSGLFVSYLLYVSDAHAGDFPLGDERKF